MPAANAEQIADRVQRHLGHSVKVRRVQQGMIFEHRNASYYVAELNLDSRHMTVPVATEFSDHPEYDEEQIVDKAMEQLRPRLQHYFDRGYELQETEWRPSQPAEMYDENQIPVFVAYVERRLDDDDTIDEELGWLIDQLPDR